jgi:hypothetical protein
MQRSRRKGSRCKRNIQISLGFGLGLGFALGVAKTHGNTNEPTHPKSQPPAAAAMESQPGPRWEADPTRPFQSGSCMQSPTRRARKRNRGRGLGWVHAGRWDSLGIRVPGDQTSRARATRFTFPIPFPANEARLLTAVVLPPASGRGGTRKCGAADAAHGPKHDTGPPLSLSAVGCVGLWPCVRRARIHVSIRFTTRYIEMNNSR